jgi:hypothetical protein
VQPDDTADQPPAGAEQAPRGTVPGAPPPDAPVPPVLYVPVDVGSDGAVTDVRMLRLGDGRVALIAYTALDRLAAGCGADVPWALVETRKLGEVHATKPYDVKLLDVDLPAEVRARFAGRPA